MGISICGKVSVENIGNIGKGQTLSDTHCCVILCSALTKGTINMMPKTPNIWV